MSQKQSTKKVNIFLPTILLILVDVLLVNAGFLLAFEMRFVGDIPRRSLEPFLNIVPLLSIATVVIFMGFGLYEKRRNGLMSLIRAALISVVTIFFVTMALTFWFRGFSFPRGVLLLGMVIQVLLITTWRTGCWYLEKRLHGLRNMLVIGPYGEVEKLLEKVLDLPRGWFRVHKILDSSNIDQLDIYLNDIDAVLMVPSLGKEKKARVLVACQESRREVFLVPDFYDILVCNARVAQLDDLPVMEIRDISLSWGQRIIKRTLDICISSIGLLIVSPVMIICALLVRLTSLGPVFYSQQRVGRGKYVFRLYKFRSMVQDAEKKTGPVLAADNDSRITPVGKFLRATRLDELPQLFNVLKGEMSFVGPRPERPVFVDEFDRQYPDYHYRHLVKPGITGLAQVAGKYTTSPEDKLRFDLYYIRNYSFFLDIKIILQTIPVLLSRESSAGKKKLSKEKRAAIHYLVNGSYETSALKESKNVAKHARLINEDM